VQLAVKWLVHRESSQALDAGGWPTRLFPTRTGLVITHLFGICCRLMLAASDENRLAAMAYLSMLAVDHAECQRRELVWLTSYLSAVSCVPDGRILARKRRKIAKLIFTRSAFLGQYRGSKRDYSSNLKTSIAAQK